MDSPCAGDKMKLNHKRKRQAHCVSSRLSRLTLIAPSTRATDPLSIERLQGKGLFRKKLIEKGQIKSEENLKHLSTKRAGQARMQ